MNIYLKYLMVPIFYRIFWKNYRLNSNEIATINSTNLLYILRNYELIAPNQFFSLDLKTCQMN